MSLSLGSALPAGEPTGEYGEESPLLAVPRLVQHFSCVWWDGDGTAVPGLRTYAAPEQSSREDQLDRFQALLSEERKEPPRDEAGRRATLDRLLAAFRRLAAPALDLEDKHVDFLVDSGFLDRGIEFTEQARQFDPGLRAEDVFQASRNALVMHNLQVLLGLPVELTPAILGYSLIYPYSDNYLDDDAVSPEEKQAFNCRLAARLVGEDVAPAAPHEAAIWKLVAMIESQFDRVSFPHVAESLQAIHRAQTRSVSLLARDAPPYDVDVLGISLEKGGTSVLADGYLVVGDLLPEQVSFFFGLGCFLQLGDDLQDLYANRQAGLTTVYSQTAGHWPLDRLTSRTARFGERVLASVNCFPQANVGVLDELMAISTTLLLVEAVAHARRFHTRCYWQAVEQRSPVRFSYLDRRRKKLGRDAPLFTALLESLIASQLPGPSPAMAP